MDEEAILAEVPALLQQQSCEDANGKHYEYEVIRRRARGDGK